jgi:hypothetical protein
VPLDNRSDRHGKCQHVALAGPGGRDDRFFRYGDL